MSSEEDQESRIRSKENMSDSKNSSFLPLYNPMLPPSDDEAKKPPIPPKDKVAMYASKIAQSSGASSNISPVPMHKNIATMYGQLTPAPGRLTPTGQGRIKAPPVCIAPALKRVASSIDDFNTDGVCFSPKEAENCAEKAILADEKGGFGGRSVEEMPLNVEQCDSTFSWKGHAESTLSEGKSFVSSNSTVITTSSAGSCCRSVMGSEVAAMAAVSVKRGPPLEVVRTDLAVNSEDEHLVPKSSSSTALSSSFTNNLIKENASRQGRSLQRWLVHSPTNELVRQVAGTIPITRDGRIILVSASRKTEWILPKGGWDADETKEECAARETFEEGGILGKLGGCLDPIDYETRKAKKRRLSQIAGEDSGGKDVTTEEGKKSDGAKMSLGGERNDEMRPPLPKRVKMDKAVTSNSLSLTGNQAGASDQEAKNKAMSPPAASAPIDPKNYSYVRLFLFPLYVSSVKSEWPEKGRLRKLVDIDEAIKIMEAEKRQYFKRGLEMVKERGLHLLQPEEGLS